MSARIKDSERLSVITEYIKTGKAPDGYKVVELKDNRYRVQKMKLDKQVLEDKKKRLMKQLEDIDLKLKSTDEQRPMSNKVDKSTSDEEVDDI